MYIVENLQDKRVAAYFGTRNLYGKMIPAAKSLMCNSNVEEICLLIEDDDLRVKIARQGLDDIKKFTVDKSYAKFKEIVTL